MAKYWRKRLRQAAIRTFLRGPRVRCPFCGFSAWRAGTVGHDLPLFRRERVAGAGRRPGRCLACEAWDREQLIRLYLERVSGLLTDPGALAVLHIAPEGRLSAWLNTLGLGRYERGDLGAPGYRLRPGVEAMDVTDLPQASQTFDLVLCNHVLEHVPEDRQAMDELFRVLKAGGRAILQVPLALDAERTREDRSVRSAEERTALYGQADHVRLYGHDYVERLAGRGFRVESLDIAGRFPGYALNPLELLHVAHRDA